ncbi:hypothetical protein E1B28_006485 [Marasmius oreades]|uniref:Uncharacterized protein n=1 Tax=Marasmius oreades TaxID=181124 RepID=A0A9P7S5Z4_9AGAR|nr:uncharacterized protein E1B28_006485 [Marasmius oreades]KAG7095783.1 hypothetical protein E1B28_006485 [Marasmius oreades]
MPDNTDTRNAKHSPAVKVGGRRRSATTKPKPHSKSYRPTITSESSDNTVNDYPRPVAQTEEPSMKMKKDKQKQGLKRNMQSTRKYQAGGIAQPSSGKLV